jgi:gliding motility-associated-like protein
VLQVFSNNCSSLTSLGCTDNGASGQPEVFNYSNYVIGQTYKVRIYHYGAGSGSGNFTICLTNAVAPPSNDACGNAVALNVNSTCVFQTFSNNGATNSFPGCSGNADDDVWFKFIATNAVQEIKVNPISSMDPVVQLYSGACNSLFSLACMDNAFTGGMETVNAVGLIPGQTYFFRVYDYYSGTTGNFEVCVNGSPSSAPTNDEPCSAVVMPVVTSECTYATFTNVGSTASTGGGIPTPSGCVGGSGAAIGGFSSATGDVWFEITVPSSGSIHITAQPNLGAGALTDATMALYSGTCSSLNQIACSDDHDYPGGDHDLLPFISESGLTPGSKVYLRYFGYGSARGDFGICVSTATNDDCANALYICDINGYKGSTGAFYTRDHPGNMRANAEMNNPPTYTWTPGTNQGGIFGQGGFWGNGSPNNDVRIDNNSWIKFTASASTATLNVSIYDCYIGNYPSGGIQMQIFSGNNCTNFVPVSNFEESSTGFVITANGLTVGSDYYLMVDGYGGDICGYTISANTGVLFPNIPSVPPICAGGSVTLTAPAGATSYEWAHNGATTQSVTVSPGATTTYTCEVSGLCDYKQTLQTQVVVKPNPTISFSTGNSTSVCSGESVAITAGGASSYSWSNGQTGSTINVTPVSNTSYTVTGTLDGCQTSEQVSVSINSLPGLSSNPLVTSADCGLSNGALTGAAASGAGPFSYQWTSNGGNIVSNSASATNIPAGLYSLNVTDANGCSNDFGPYSISNPGAPAAPSISVSNNAVCTDENVSFTINSPDPSMSYEWSGPNGFTSTNNSFSVPVNQATDGSYCVVATASNCVGPSSCETVSVLPPPSLSLNSSAEDTVTCIGGDVDLSVSGANTYNWFGPNGFSAGGAQVTVVNVAQSDEGWYNVQANDANGCSAEDSIFVSIAELPSADAMGNSASQSSFCDGTVAQLYGAGGTSYSWAGPNGFTSVQQNAGIPSFSSDNTGIYTLTVTDANGCQDQDSVMLSISELDDFNVTASDTSVCPGDDVTLLAEGAETYAWFGPNGFTSTGSSVDILSIPIDQAGTYYVEGVSSEGCYGEDSISISVIISRGCLFIPGFVSPNGDGLNDGWVITGIEAFPDAEVYIYNRWGNLAFFATPYENDWIGQVNKGVNMGDGSGKVPTGTYFYVIKLNDGIDEPIKGYIELQY